MERVIVITGCSSSLGTKLAKKYIDEGDFVYGIATSDANVFNLKYIPSDITNEDMCLLVIKKILDEKGKIDILINNATIGSNGPLELTDKKQIKKMLDVNILGTINMTKAVLPTFKKQGYGKVLNLGTISSLVLSPYESVFTAIKTAVLEFSKQMRYELKNFNIQTCCVLYNSQSIFSNDKIMQIKDVCYKTKYENFIKNKTGEKEINLEKLAKEIYKISIKKNIPTCRIIGLKNKLYYFRNKFLPQKIRYKILDKKCEEKKDN